MLSNHLLPWWRSAKMARYDTGRVEGWIDGRKILEGEIPEDRPGAKSGRFALWAFETWTEFDNITVTRLVREDG